LFQPQHPQPNGEHYQFSRHDDEISRLKIEVQALGASLYQTQQEKANLLMRMRGLDGAIDGYKVMLGRLVESNTRLGEMNQRLTTTLTSDERTVHVNQIVTAQTEGLLRRIDEIERLNAEFRRTLARFVSK
jgi:chromosome segregation ATPase